MDASIAACDSPPLEEGPLTNPIVRFFRQPAGQRVGKRTGRLAKRWLVSILDRVLPVPANGSLSEVTKVERVLVVRPNFRIGNALMTAPLVPALGACFPGARIEVLTGDTVASLLEHLPIDALHVVSRRFVLRPWKFASLFWRLRQRRFDVAIDAGMGSFSGGLYSYLAGAPHRIGCSGGADRFLTIRLEADRSKHVYDGAPAFSRQLGVECASRPIYRVSPEEAADATQALARAGLHRDGAVRPFVALFVGGHLDKRWPRASWADLISKLSLAGATFLVFSGPEEQDLVTLLSRVAPGVTFVPPGPLRAFASLLARAAVVVTTDSGALHLSVALERPTIALLQRERSLRFRPRGPLDISLLRPTADDAFQALCDHPTWSSVCPDRCRNSS